MGHERYPRDARDDRADDVYWRCSAGDQYDGREGPDHRDRGGAADDRFQRGYYSAGSSADVPRGIGRVGRPESEYDTGGGDGSGRSSQGRYQGAGSHRRPGLHRGNADRGQRALAGYSYDDRTFLNRAADEVRSWFGDDEAEQRRELDQRHDRCYARGNARDALS